MTFKDRDFLKLLDFTPEEIEYLIDFAASLKAKKKAGIPHKICDGKNVALIFEKTSTRTRCSFEVAARDLGMRVVCFDRKGRSEISDVETVDDMDAVFSAADYLTLHIPCNDSTRNIINAESIGKMKDGVRILNFARGELVNSDDILASLADGKVAAYATDFPTDAQLGVPGVIAIPHLGASTPESEDNCAVMAADELISYIARGEVKNSVNLPELTPPAEFEKRVCVIYKDGEGVRENIVAALGGNITSLNSAVKNGLGYLVCDTPNPDSEKLTAVGGVVRVRVI